MAYISEKTAVPPANDHFERGRALSYCPLSARLQIVSGDRAVFYASGRAEYTAKIK